MKHLTLEFDSLEEFYQAAKTKNTIRFGREHPDDIEEEKKDFRYLSNADIHKYKNGYSPGIEKLESYDEFIPPPGNSSFKYKWNDTDGDEMDLERAYEGKPFLAQRIRKKGIQNGKFITLYVAVHENAGVTHNKLINRTFTAVSIADYLENQGFRVEIIAFVIGKNTGAWLGIQEVEYLTMYIPIKQFNEDLNKSLLLTALSPWFFRYWVFLFWTNNMAAHYGLGFSVSFKSLDVPLLTATSIIIDNGECLTTQDSIRKIEEVSDFFGDGDV